MKVLLDECLPARLAKSLAGHEVKTVSQMNWNGLKNGKLLEEAAKCFEVFITVDKNLIHQQPLERFKIAVVVIKARSNKLRDLLPLVPQHKSWSN